jgi:hypothetical protein
VTERTIMTAGKNCKNNIYHKDRKKAHRRGSKWVGYR